MKKLLRIKLFFLVFLAGLSLQAMASDSKVDHLEGKPGGEGATTAIGKKAREKVSEEVAHIKDNAGEIGQNSGRDLVREFFEEIKGDFSEIAEKWGELSENCREILGRCRELKEKAANTVVNVGGGALLGFSFACLAEGFHERDWDLRAFCSMVAAVPGFVGGTEVRKGVKNVKERYEESNIPGKKFLSLLGSTCRGALVGYVCGSIPRRSWRTKKLGLALGAGYGLFSGLKKFWKSGADTK